MALEADFLALMKDSVAIAFRTSQDGYGAPIFGTPLTYRARVEPHVKRSPWSPSARSGNVSGDSVENWSSSRTFVTGAPFISEWDRITLPDGSVPVILSVEHVNDERGDHHQVVWT